jgi:hypothetical protein
MKSKMGNLPQFPMLGPPSIPPRAASIRPSLRKERGRLRHPSVTQGAGKTFISMQLAFQFVNASPVCGQGRI